MIDETQVRIITKKVLEEENLLGFIKIFEKEHNLFRGSHDKIQLAQDLNVPQTVINLVGGNIKLDQLQDLSITDPSTGAFLQYDEGLEAWKSRPALTPGSVVFIDANSYFAQDNANLFWDNTAKILKVSGLSIRSKKELRFYDNGNYVGFEAPDLAADFIWKLPAVDGAANDVVGTDGNGNLIWITGTSLGNVIAASNFGTDNVLIRSDGTGKGVQHTGIVIDDNDHIGLGVAPHTRAMLYIFTPNAQAAEYVGADIRTYSNKAGSNYGLLAHAVGSGGTKNVGLYATASNAINNVAAWLDGNVGIGTDSPESYFAGATNSVIYSTANTGMTIASGTEGQGRIHFADGTLGTGEYEGIIIYYHATNSMGFYANHTLGMTLDNAQALTLTGNLILSSATSTITGGTNLFLESGDLIKSQTIYDETGIAEPNVVVGATYALYRSTSSKKYKDKIKDLEVDSSLIYNLKPRSFNSVCKGDDKNKRFVGLIAEDVEEYLPEIVIYGKNNEVENYENRGLITLMLAEIQRHEVRIKELEARLNN